MWPFRKKDEPTRLTVDEYVRIFEIVSDKVAKLNEEARMQHMVETGLLPQAHLSRQDTLKNRRALELAGMEAIGREVAEGHFKADPDLTRRDD